MLLFIGPHIKANGSNDGVTSRVMAIDSLFSTERRIYLNISYSKYLTKKIIEEDNYTVINCNYFVHYSLIHQLMSQATKVYVHTMMNYLRCIPSILLNKKVIVDVHGVLVDELKYNHAPWWKIRLYTIIEKLIMKYANKIICVTEQMKDYFVQKHSINSNKIIVLPIFYKKINLGEIKDKNYDMQTVIYAGNLDKWQNIDEMLGLAYRYHNFNYQFLVSDLARFKSILDKNQIKNANIKYNSVPKEEVPSYYANASFGFVIRDNNILNRVSCPTKLIEYISNGVIPIMNDFQLGDFNGLRYISVNDFKNNRIPNRATLKQMAFQNAILYNKIYTKATEAANLLRKIVNDKNMEI